MKYFVTVLILLSGISAYASCTINNLYEIKPEQNSISAKKRWFNKKEKEIVKPAENIENASPFMVFPNNNNNKSGSNVYIWKHEP